MDATTGASLTTTIVCRTLVQTMGSGMARYNQWLQPGHQILARVELLMLSGR